jgi:Fe-S cluster assembly protein SufD
MVETKSKNEARPHQNVITAFEQLERGAQGNAPSWLQALRKGGISHFAELGFPTIQQEEWRFTNVSAVAKMPFRLAEAEVDSVRQKDIASLEFSGLSGKRIVFIDGKFSPELSSKDLVPAQGVKLLNIEAAAATAFPMLSQTLARYARYEDNPFVALNTAFLTDGAVVFAPARQVMVEPIYILYVSTAREEASTHPRTLIIAQRDSEIKVIEHYITLGSAKVFTNAVTEIVLEESAKVEHCKVQDESLATYHVATIQTHQARNSNLLSHSISPGALLARNNINCVLDGERVECTLNGLYLGRENQLVDHHTAIFHNKPNCNSHEYYHGILDGRSQGVFSGKIFVRPEAQKTDAKQTNRNLLLSDEATVDTKPQLEIFADDVKCTHGATIGQLDPESIFYLRARGISYEVARKMLLHAFASEIVNRITIEPVRDRIDQQLFDLYER